MSYFKRRNIQQSKLLGANTYTSCFNFDQSAESDEFDDHLLNNMPIVQISNVLQRIPHKITAKPILPDLQSKRTQSLLHPTTALSFKQSSTESPSNSCDVFERYQEINLHQSHFFSSQIEPIRSKATFRCHSLRKYSTQLENHLDLSDFNGLKTQGKRTIIKAASLTKRQSQNSSKQTPISCRKKYSHRELTRRIPKQNSAKSKFGELSPWKMETEELLF